MYVSRSDVEVAATLHPKIIGEYPFYNISARLTEPSTGRLMNISKVDSQPDRRKHISDIYTYFEDEKG